MEIEDRIPEFILIIGYNGTGKTTIAKLIIINELKTPKGRALIVTPDDIEFSTIPQVNGRFTHRIDWYVKARKIIYYTGCLQDIAQYFHSGLLFFDDCRAYLTAPTDQDLHTLLIRRRQKCIDIMAAGHGFTDIPPKFFTFASKIILFKTQDNIQKRKNVIRDFDRILDAQERINEKAKTDPHYYEILNI